MAQTSTKHSLIDKANTTMVVATAVAAFVVVFSVVASKSLLSQAAYQNRVIGAKRDANSQLEKDIDASKDLITSYKTFVSTPQNIIGGNSSGTGDRDGDNAKIVLDALPSKYDFPALASSLEKILGSQGVQITSITGTDAQLTEGDNKGSANPAPVPMPFTASVTGNYQAMQNLVGTFEKSIRPFQIQNIKFSGGQSNLNLTLTAQTYYQPEKTLTITTKEVK